MTNRQRKVENRIKELSKLIAHETVAMGAAGISAADKAVHQAAIQAFQAEHDVLVEEQGWSRRKRVVGFVRRNALAIVAIVLLLLLGYVGYKWGESADARDGYNVALESTKQELGKMKAALETQMKANGEALAEKDSLVDELKQQLQAERLAAAGQSGSNKPQPVIAPLPGRICFNTVVTAAGTTVVVIPAKGSGVPPIPVTVDRPGLTPALEAIDDDPAAFALWGSPQMASK